MAQLTGNGYNGGNGLWTGYANKVTKLSATMKSRRPPVATYELISSKLGSGENLSMRKKVCLSYLKYLVYPDRDHCFAFVELAKEWRKRDKRIGLPRTKLEQIARKYFRRQTVHKNNGNSRNAARKWAEKSLEDKIGVHSPEYMERMRENNKRNRQNQTEQNRDPNTTTWVVYPPNHPPFVFKNLRKLCRMLGFSNKHIYKTAYQPGFTYKKWRVERFNPEIHNDLPKFDGSLPAGLAADV